MENKFKWQPGLISHETIEGESGEEGSKTRLVFNSNKGEFDMIETISRRAFPREFHTTYTAKGVYNEMYNYFTESIPGKTDWKLVSVYKFKWSMRIMALFMGSAFKNETLLSMERFKAFCETNSKS